MPIANNTVLFLASISLIKVIYRLNPARKRVANIIEIHAVPGKRKLPRCHSSHTRGDILTPLEICWLHHRMGKVKLLQIV